MQKQPEPPVQPLTPVKTPTPEPAEPSPVRPTSLVDERKLTQSPEPVKVESPVKTPSPAPHTPESPVVVAKSPSPPQRRQKGIVVEETKVETVTVVHTPSPEPVPSPPQRHQHKAATPTSPVEPASPSTAEPAEHMLRPSSPSAMMGSPGTTGIVEYDKDRDLADGQTSNVNRSERIVVTKHKRETDIDFGQPISDQSAGAELASPTMDKDDKLKAVAEQLADWDAQQPAPKILEGRK
jgi:hypothetical protein